ncbi:MAG: radical SAM protein [Acidobacteriota bacterium]
MRPPLVLIPQYFGSLLFDRRTSRYLPFDAEATSFLRELCEVPAAELVAAHPNGSDALDFARRIDALEAWGADGRLGVDVLDADPPDDHLLGPLATHVEVVGSCNLSCTHCFAAPLPRTGRPLSLVELGDLFRQLAALGSLRLGLTGGEPLLRKDILDVLDSATDAGLHPCLTTNGFQVTDDLARALGQRELVWINVSLDGATPETNDRVRGAGSFERAIEGIRRLARWAKVTVAFTITSDNADEIRACADLADRLGAHCAVFRPLYPTGAALEQPELMPTWDAYQAALASLAEAGSSSRGLDPFSPEARSATAGRVHPGHGCGAATTVASVSVDGQVNPCSFLGTEFEAGNVRDQPFRALWDAGASFLSLRNERGESFRGGCRARARAATGSVRGRDPWEEAWRHGLGESPSRTMEVSREG